jgi:hypothetical protein
MYGIQYACQITVTQAALNMKPENCIHEEIKEKTKLSMLATMQFRTSHLPACYLKGNE